MEVVHSGCDLLRSYCWVEVVVVDGVERHSMPADEESVAAEVVAGFAAD